MDEPSPSCLHHPPSLLRLLLALSLASASASASDSLSTSAAVAATPASHTSSRALLQRGGFLNQPLSDKPSEQTGEYVRVKTAAAFADAVGMGEPYIVILDHLVLDSGWSSVEPPGPLSIMVCAFPRFLMVCAFPRFLMVCAFPRFLMVCAFPRFLMVCAFPRFLMVCALPCPSFTSPFPTASGAAPSSPPFNVTQPACGMKCHHLFTWLIASC
jgi:hypothetical protein